MDAVRATVIRNGELLTPEPAGRTDLLVIGDRIAALGGFDAILLERGGLEVDVVKADGAWVVPRNFHVGPGKCRLRCLHELLDAERLQVDPAWPYPTHVQRSEALLDEAIALVRRGPRWTSMSPTRAWSAGCRVTSNAAAIPSGSRSSDASKTGADADITILDSESLEVVHVLARGSQLVRDGELITRERTMDESNRRLELHGVEG